MTRKHLEIASENLQQARDAVTDDNTRERLNKQASEMEQLAETDQGPDHGRLARHERILSSIKEEVDPEAGETINTALEHVRSYRKTIEGV